MQDLKEVFKKAREAYKLYSTFSQSEVDKIFKKAALVANENRILLAKMACEETKKGVVEDKVIKNHYASEVIYNSYKNLQTVGTFYENKTLGIQKIWTSWCYWSSSSYNKPNINSNF